MQAHLPADRHEFSDGLTRFEIRALAQDMRIRVLQTANPVNDRTWQLLDNEFFERRPDVQLRVYAHYGHVCDLSFLRRLRNVRNFSADCLADAVNVDAVCSIRIPSQLSIGIWSLESFDFLRDVDAAELKGLSLGATKSAKPNLNALPHFTELRRLYVEGPRKDLEPIAELGQLDDLTLRSCVRGSLSFLRSSANLRSLAIKLGSAKDIDDIAGLKGLRYLELWQVLGLSDLSAVSQLTGLQFLFLQSLKHVTRLPDLSCLTQLRRVHLETMHGLTSATELEAAPALEELVWLFARTMSPSDLTVLLKRGKLRLAVGFGSTRRNDELLAMMRDAGITEYRHSDFVFV